MGKVVEQTCLQIRDSNGQKVHETLLNVTDYQGNAN